MIKEIEGNALNVEADVLAHQTNYGGVMGAGIALQIKNKLLSKENFEEYYNHCVKNGNKLLGTIQILTTPSDKKVANVFGQIGMSTSNEALREALIKLHDYALTTEHKTVVIPGYIGCGIAGGDWNEVHNIIEQIFADAEVDLTIVYFKEGK